MKTAIIFPSLLVIATILLLGSCTAYQKAEWSVGSGATAPSSWGNNPHGMACQHNPNYMGNMSSSSIFSMRNDYYNFCYKCGRYVRERQ